MTKNGARFKPRWRPRAIKGSAGWCTRFSGCHCLLAEPTPAFAVLVAAVRCRSRCYCSFFPKIALAIGGRRLAGRGPIQRLEIFEAFDRQKLALVGARLPAFANEFLHFIAPLVIISDTAVNQDVSAPCPSTGDLHYIQVSHSL